MNTGTHIRSAETQSNSAEHSSLRRWSDQDIERILEALAEPATRSKFLANKRRTCQDLAVRLFGDSGPERGIALNMKVYGLEKIYWEAENERLRLVKENRPDKAMDLLARRSNRFHEACRRVFDVNSSTHSQPQEQEPADQGNQSVESGVTMSGAGVRRRVPEVLPAESVDDSPFLPSAPSRPQSTLPLETVPINTDSTPVPNPLHFSDPSGPTVSSRAPSIDLPSVSAGLPYLPQSTTVYSRRTRTSVKLARYAAKQAAYMARQAEFEAIKAKQDKRRMRYALRLAIVKKQRESLILQKLEKRLKLSNAKSKS